MICSDTGRSVGIESIKGNLTHLLNIRNGFDDEP